jgi:hypothetical protein
MKVTRAIGHGKVKFGGTLRSRLENRRAVETLFKVVMCNAEQANYRS